MTTWVKLNKTSFRTSWQLLIIPVVDIFIMSWFNLNLIMPVLKDTKIWQRNWKISYKLHKKMHQICLKLNFMEHKLNEHFKRLNWLSMNPRIRCVSFTFYAVYMSGVFRLAKNKRMNARKSSLKWNHHCTCYLECNSKNF